jgi:diguanylate cyclase (GGDEF)-like protein
MPADFVSVKQSVDRMDQLEKQCRCAVESFIALIGSIDRHTLSVHPELEREFHDRFVTLQRRLARETGEAVLEEARLAMDHDLQDHANQAVGLFHQKTEEISRILLILAEATDAIQNRWGSYSNRFRQIANRLERVAALQDLGEIRRSLGEHVGELNQGVDTMNQDSHELVHQMKKEMEAVQRRLSEAEKLAETDLLTGLLNRRGMERRLEEISGTRERFCVVLFDLNRFKAINDRYGHPCGDEVLKAFARRMETQLRPGDFLCRWGGDEFLALLRCNLKDTMARVRAIGPSVCGAYTVKAGATEVRVEISTSVGVAEHQPGGSSTELVARADRLMYQSKQPASADIVSPAS